MYSAQDKWEMTLRQARSDIGQGRGNALSKAVDLVIGFKNYRGGSVDREIISNDVFYYADKFAEFNQKRIDLDFNKWLNENGSRIRKELGLSYDNFKETDQKLKKTYNNQPDLGKDTLSKAEREEFDRKEADAHKGQYIKREGYNN